MSGGVSVSVMSCHSCHVVVLELIVLFFWAGPYHEFPPLVTVSHDGCVCVWFVWCVCNVRGAMLCCVTVVGLQCCE